MPSNAPDVTTSAINSIIRYQRDREAVASQRTPPGATLFHYTTADGLKGIVENNALWATSAYYLNDSAEVIYGYGVLSQVLDAWISAHGSPESSLALHFAQALAEGFGTALFNRSIIYPIYLACFCEDGNLLSQWRAYGQSGGYCVGFKAMGEGEVLGIKPETAILTARWIKVEYDRTLQAQRCLEILDSLLPSLDEPELVSAVTDIGHPPPYSFQDLLNVIREILLEESLAFKNKAFEVEKEWRIVVRSRSLREQGKDDHGASPDTIHFRSARGLLTPYTKLVPSNGADLLSMKYPDQLPIESVRTGPTRDQTTASMATRWLLDKHGYTQTHVFGAEIPLSF